MTLYFIRHADKAENRGTKPGWSHLEQPLSSHGRQQSKRLCKYFLHKSITGIYVSEYVRTKQTIEPLAKRRNIIPVTDARLNEIDRGALVGVPDEQFRIHFPDVWTAYQKRETDFRWPGGETGEEAQARIAEFLSEHNATEGDMIAVTHDGTIRVLACYVLRLPVYRRFEFRIDTAGILEIQRAERNGEWRIVRFNQVPE
jgi:broad specificity phosphatase PhoE